MREYYYDVAASY